MVGGSLWSRCHSEVIDCCCATPRHSKGERLLRRRRRVRRQLRRQRVRGAPGRRLSLLRERHPQRGRRVHGPGGRGLPHFSINGRAPSFADCRTFPCADYPPQHRQPPPLHVVRKRDGPHTYVQAPPPLPSPSWSADQLPLVAFGWASSDQCNVQTSCRQSACLGSLHLCVM